MPFARIIPAVLLAIGLAAASAAPAQPVLHALTAIQPGQWEVRVAGEDPQAICLSGPDLLFQIRHRAIACSRLVVADSKAAATVHYSCPGAGWGRTTVRVSTPVAVHISTQGIADNAPFDFEAAAKRIGDCPAQAASR